MKQVHLCIVALCCAVLALAEPEPVGGRGNGFGGQQRELGGNGGSSYSQPQRQQQSLPYGANTQSGSKGFGGNNGGRFSRSPEPPVFGGGNGGSSYSQPQKQQQSLPYGANTQFGNQGFVDNNGGRFARSPEPPVFGGGNGGFGGSSYSQPQKQQSGLPYGANTQFGSQGFGGNNGGRFARSPKPQGFGGNGGNGGISSSSYTQRQQQQSGLPYGANTQFGNQGFGGNNGGRFARSPEPPVFGGGNGGFGGSSYSQSQKQQSGLPYGANTQFGNQGLGGNNGGRFARSPEPPVFGGGNGGIGGSSYSQPQKQQQSLPYGANTQFGNQGFGGNNGRRFARSPEPPVFGGGNGGFGGSSYSQPQKQQSGLPYGANTQFGGQGLGTNNGGRFARSPEPQGFGGNGGNGGISSSSYSQRQQQQNGLPYGANTQFGGQGFGANNGGRFARSPEPPVFGGGNGGFGGPSYSQPQKQQSGLPYGANTQFGGQGFGGNNGGRFARSPEPQGFGGNGGNGGISSSSYSQRQQQQSGLPYGANAQFGGQGISRS